MPVGIEHLRVVLQELGEFVPFAVSAGMADLIGQVFESFEHADFDLEFRDRACRRCLIDDFLLGLLNFGVRSVVQVVQVVLSVRGQPGNQVNPDLGSAFEELLLTEAFFQALAPAAE